MRVEDEQVGVVQAVGVHVGENPEQVSVMSVVDAHDGARPRVRIDDGARVLGADGHPVAGLLAPGSDTGGLWHRAYAGGIASALVFGPPQPNPRRDRVTASEGTLGAPIRREVRPISLRGMHSAGLEDQGLLPGARPARDLLQFTEMSVPVVLDACQFDEVPLLRGARIRELVLTGCSLPGLVADTAQIDGRLVLSRCHLT